MNKIGLYFGTFDPFHIAHYWVAKFLLIDKLMDKVWYILSPQSPCKQSHNILPFDCRFKILFESICSEQNMDVMDIENHLPTPSYTSDTLKVLLKKFPQYHFSIIMGLDNLKTFSLWKDYTFIQNHASIIGYPRLGESLELGNMNKNYIIKNDLPNILISSTILRKKIKQREEYSAFLKGGAYNLIKKNAWYQ